MAYGNRFEQALGFAARLHRDQTRKGTDIPYVTHLLAVAALVGEHGGDEDTAIAALLHDAIEDQGGDATRQTIRDGFGSRVAALVDSCTDTDVVPKPPWRERKEAYIAHLLDPATPLEACLISAADKLHNARCLLADLRTQGDDAFTKFTGAGGKAHVLWYYQAVLGALQQRLPGHPLVDDLARTATALAAR